MGENRHCPIQTKNILAYISKEVTLCEGSVYEDKREIF